MSIRTSYGRLFRAPREIGRRGADALFDLTPLRRRERGRSRKVVVVHPGFRKTGTTTIQKMLLENAALLGDHVGLVMRWTDPSSEEMHKAGQKYAAAPGPATARRVRRAARAMAAAIGEMPQPVVILSDENIIGRRVVAGDRDIFDMAAAALAIVEEEFAGHDLRIVLTTRSRPAWMRSCYNQDVKRHKFAGDLDAWIAAHDGCRDWEEGARVLAASLTAPVRFLPMEDDLTAGRFLGRSLLEIAGLSDELLDRITPPQPQNPSLDPVQLEFIREINTLDLSYGITGRVVDVVRRRRDLFRRPGDGTPDVSGAGEAGDPAPLGSAD